MKIKINLEDVAERVASIVALATGRTEDEVFMTNFTANVLNDLSQEQALKAMHQSIADEYTRQYIEGL